MLINAKLHENSYKIHSTREVKKRDLGIKLRFRSIKMDSVKSKKTVKKILNKCGIKRNKITKNKK